MNNEKILIAPSILSADFSIMGEEVKNLEKNGADVIHVDVMDGVFVSNITFGMKMVKDIRKLTTLPLDCHLMIVEPWKYVEKFAESGADYITVHYEACKERLEVLGYYVGDTQNPEFDELLQQVVAKFQSDCELYSYGVLDSATMFELFNRSGEFEVEEDTQLEFAKEYMKNR